MELAQIIIQKIKNEGPISFHEFMEMALYYPSLGYYNSPKNIIGKEGDFYTSASITPAFGAMVARQIEQMWQLTGEEEFAVIEYGAGTGMLCHDILFYLKNNSRLYDVLTYCIIEKSEVLKLKQQKYLPHQKVSWYNNINQLPAVTGCILSNELLDNFAVHQVVMQQQLMEVYVDYENGFIETLQPANNELVNYFKSLNVQLPEGFTAEVNLQAKYWLAEIAACLIKGFIITIDYGCLIEELYSERKKRGTIVCYHEHQVNENPYQNIGGQDITAHVNFSALQYWGKQYGFDNCAYITQAEFLLALGFKDYLLKILQPADDLMKLIKLQAFITHTLLVDMGSKFKVLIQSKNTGKHALQALSFGKPLQHIDSTIPF